MQGKPELALTADLVKCTQVGGSRRGLDWGQGTPVSVPDLLVTSGSEVGLHVVLDVRKCCCGLYAERVQVEMGSRALGMRIRKGPSSRSASPSPCPHLLPNPHRPP